MKAKRSLKVLHLASFAGNIGDIANHTGAKHLFETYLDYEFVFTELEIREFYWKSRKFDDEFVAYANKFDLMIVGGGNYFELWVQESQTGTSIDIAPARLRALKVPTLFYSLGVDIGQGYTEQSASRFRAFLETVMSRPEMFVCIRNDGSRKALDQVTGDLYARTIPVVPDGGFFAQGFNAAPSCNDTMPGRVIAINIAGDMLQRRFDATLSPEQFLNGMARFCKNILGGDEDIELEFIPHIWRDVSLLGSLLPLLPDEFVRRRVRIAGMQTQRHGLAAFLGTYKRASLVLGNRFHANVCPIGMKTPTRGLFNYPQVGHLYAELALADRLNDMRHEGFEEKLLVDVVADLRSLQSVKAIYEKRMVVVEELAREGMKIINGWLDRQFTSACS